VDALLETRPPVFSFVFGIPSPAVLAECRRREIVTLGAAITLAEARALDEAGVDLILATGFEAGGHRPSFLARAEDSLVGTLALTGLAAERVRAPVIAAGGIVDAGGIRAALALGAQAAQSGTAFLACAESGTTDAHRAALFGDAGERTALTRAYTGRLARGIPNRLVAEIEARQAELPPFPAHAWFVAQLKAAAAAAGRTDLAPLYAGQAAPNLRHRTAAELMEALIRDLSN
jgi:nitronate monooxygenase